MVDGKIKFFKIRVMRKILAICTCLFFSLSASPSHAAAGLTISATTAYTATIENVGAIWKGNIPTKISYGSGSSSQKLEFQIQGILPHSVLADRATGTDVEFELWSEQGKKIAYDNIYSSEWNPVGPNTLVSMYLYESEAIGSHTMIVRTIYELSTTGLLTRYLKAEQRFPVVISLVKKPATIDLTSGSYETDGVSVGFTPLSDLSSSSYELGMRFLKAPGLDVKVTSNFTDFVYVGSAESPKTFVKYSDIRKYAAPYISNFENSAVGIAVRGKNGQVVGDWGKWYYFETNNLLTYERNQKYADERAETRRQDRISKCASLNSALPALAELIDKYIAKYPKVSTFSELRSKLPSALDCSNAGADDMQSTIDVQDFNMGSIDSDLLVAMKLADNPKASSSKKTTISCVKGTLTKKVSGVSPKCPSGYKKK
jgi:hypothetical protein